MASKIPPSSDADYKASSHVPWRAERKVDLAELLHAHGITYDRDQRERRKWEKKFRLQLAEHILWAEERQFLSHQRARAAAQLSLAASSKNKNSPIEGEPTQSERMPDLILTPMEMADTACLQLEQRLQREGIIAPIRQVRSQINTTPVEQTGHQQALESHKRLEKSAGNSRR